MTATTATIMVVEDEPDIRELVATSLAVEGFQVLCAEDGDDALRQLAAHPEVDLVFTDIVMPGDLHGYDLARQVRARHPAIKLLYTSGYATRWRDLTPPCLARPGRTPSAGSRGPKART